MTRTGWLQGKEVELREVSIGVAIEAQKIGDSFQAALFILSHSAHWLATGERVFPSRESILNDWPMTYLREVNALAIIAGEVNMPDLDTSPATTNGTGEGLHPSP